MSCRYCTANNVAWDARVSHGRDSAEYQAALAELAPMFEAARLGRAHSATCPDRVATPLVKLG